MFKDAGLEWTIGQQAKSTTTSNPKPAEFRPPIKEINISTELLHQQFKEVKRNLQTWGIISPSIVEIIDRHLPIENVIASNRGQYQTISYVGKDNLQMERDHGLEQALATTLDFHEVKLDPSQIEKLALEYNLAHELGHALKGALSRKITQNKLIHKGEQSEKQVEPLFEEARIEVDIAFLEGNPIAEFAATSSTNFNKLYKTSDERIAQSVALAYFKHALLREGVDPSKTVEILRAIVSGTKKLYSESITFTSSLSYSEPNLAGSEKEDTINSHIIDAGYAFPVSLEDLNVFTEKIILQTAVLNQDM